MICINTDCDNGKVKCVETRASRAEATTTRKYKCQTCNAAFFTEEKFSHMALTSTELSTAQRNHMQKINEQKRADAFARLSIQ